MISDNCEFEITDEKKGTCKCVKCGFEITCKNCWLTVKQCGSVKSSAVTKIKKFTGEGWSKTKRWTKAVAKWAAAGMPNRSDEEVVLIYELCSSNVCNRFNPHGSCNVCGCKLSKSKIGFINKIRMATEHAQRNFGSFGSYNNE